MRKIGWWLLVGLAVGGGVTYMAASNMAGREAKLAIERLVTENEEVESLEYSDLTVGLLEQGGKINDVRLQLKGIEDPIVIDQLQLENVAQKEGRTVQADVSMEGLTLKHDHALLESITPELEAMGYAEVVVDATAAYQYDPQKRRLTLEKIDLSAKDMGKLSMAIILDQVNPELWEVKKEGLNLGAFLTTFALVSIGPSKIEYEDHSLLKRWIKRQAQRSGHRPEAVVRQWRRVIDQEANRNNSSIAQAALGAVKDFLADPDRITVRIAPEKPLALMRFVLESPERILENLQLQVESH